MSLCRLLFEKGLDAVYAKQWALTMEARAGIKALGLTPFAKEHYTWGLTSVLLPEGVDGKDVLSYAQETMWSLHGRWARRNEGAHCAHWSYGTC